MNNHPVARIYRSVAFGLSSLRLIPHLILWRFSPNRDVIMQDVRRWREAFLGHLSVGSDVEAFLVLMASLPEYRTLFYFRIGSLATPVKFLCPVMESLILVCPKLGPGLIIQHGIATVIVAEEIGANCWINQQVTLGISGSLPGFPTLGDNVRVSVGAKVLGGITVGSNSMIGANAVVMKNVPPNVTVVGVPGYIVRRDGVRVNEPL
ncbi:serine O-acetyltransferase [Paludisphaera mucosa]|uniref:Serine acetyltransferase n=1 Tax=Paludisphaera mucosa TaxID=3030827 RepID=A0ABT6FKG8_9BACT|nr:hypothetical protein [Paludisphaera mucosa]MDG3008059.1 hypothetical protein [Paludisphaera mucosa]